MVPESVTTVDAAMQLFGMVSALISMMAEQVSSRRQAAKGGKGDSGTTDDDDEPADNRASQAG